MQVKSFEVEGTTLKVQWNPSRMVSTAAKIDKASLERRPCFLCANHRPAVQEALSMLHDYELLVNPFPILPHHFTIPLKRHEPQRIRERFIDMMRMAEQLDDLVVFYNGPACGASAPDHLHFQAGSRGVLPVEPPCPSFLFLASTPEAHDVWFQQLYAALPVPEGQPEPMMNILAWKDVSPQGEPQLFCRVIPRKKHRPDCYLATGDAQVLVSPGALDVAGLMITPREEDFRKMTADVAVNILREVVLSPEEINQVESNLLFTD